MSVQRLHTNRRMSQIVIHQDTAPARATVEAKLCEPEILVEMTVVAAR